CPAGALGRPATDPDEHGRFALFFERNGSAPSKDRTCDLGFRKPQLAVPQPATTWPAPPIPTKLTPRHVSPPLRPAPPRRSRPLRLSPPSRERLHPRSRPRRHPRLNRRKILRQDPIREVPRRRESPRRRRRLSHRQRHAPRGPRGWAPRRQKRRHLGATRGAAPRRLLALRRALD